jgi:hypothetical protein
MEEETFGIEELERRVKRLEEALGGELARLNTRPVHPHELPRETLEKAIIEIASGVPRRDEWKSGADFMDHTAFTLDMLGIARPDRYEDV